MKPLSVDVNTPSSSAWPACEPIVGKPYEVANYAEIQFPDFRYTKRLGRGSYGTVMPCTFRGRPAAAKLVETNVDFKAIREEAELLHGFRHANIIELYALFHGEMTGLVLELMEGGSLSELLHQHKHIRYQTCHVLNWAIQVTRALSYLHAHSFIHRDIKPSNMLLTRDYIGLKLCDFGTVAELQTSMTNNRGTAAWMAPEVFRGRKYDQQCDIFSLGISLWEMIARRQPFAELGESNPVTVLWRVAESGLRPPRIQDLPEPLMELIERCWANNPDDRPCLEEVRQVIEAFLEIFPNAALLPLVDRSTSRPAFAPPVLFWTPPSPVPPHPSEPVPNSEPPMFPPSSSLMVPPPNHRRTGSHDNASKMMSNRFHQALQIPLHSQVNSHSYNDMSCLDGTPSTTTSPTRYSPNLHLLPRCNSYSPCMTPAQYPPIPMLPLDGTIEDCYRTATIENGKKRKKSYGLKKLFGGLRL